MIPTISHVNKPSKKKVLGYENLYKEIIINFFLQSVKVTYVLEKLYQLCRGQVWGFKSLNNIK
jgi:hypothetical protein